MKRLVCWSVALCAAAPGASLAADKAKIAEAIEKGVERLKADQDAETGAWRYDEEHDDYKKDARAVGMSALAVLALFENGQPITEPHVRKGLKFLRERTPTIEDTYSIALATITLARIGLRQDADLIRECAGRLMASQLQTGGWHYTTRRATRDRALKPSEEKGLGDLSVTQFAAIALWQAQRAGRINAEPALRKTRQRLAWSQTDDGGWNYHMVSDMGGGGHTMTTAGAYVWLVASASEIKQGRIKKTETLRSDTSGPIYGIMQDAAAKFKEDQAKAKQNQGPKEGEGKGETGYQYPVKSPPELNLKSPSPLVGDEVLKKALERTGAHADGLIANPAVGYYYYYMWSVQRLGVLLGAEKFGKHDWYTVGADAIVKAQHDDGSFGVPKKTDQKSHYKYGPDNAFALLFLRKANLGSDVAKLLNPDSSTPFRVAEQDRRFKTLAEAVAAAKPKEAVEISGDGPFAVAALTIDKPLRIKAAPGYEPVLRYERPKDKFGYEVDLNAAPEARTMITLKASPAVGKADQFEFEGVKFQMDPPVGVDGAFAVLKCDGVQAAFCNCTFTTASKKPGVLFEIVDSPRFLVRNAFACGFAPMFKASSAKGKTERGVRLGAQDCVFFTPRVLEASGAGDLALYLMLSSAQCVEFANLGKLSGSCKAFVEHNVLKCDRLFADMGSGARGWSGQHNLYDVGGWIEKGEGSSSRIRTPKDWMKYWEGAEVGSATLGNPFSVYRQQVGGFRHDLNPRDWSLKGDGPRRAVGLSANDQLGVNDFVLGPGDGFLQFREVGDYEAWTKLTQPSKQKTSE